MMEKSSIYQWSVGSLYFPYCQRGNRRIIEECGGITSREIALTKGKWFINLTYVGNVESATIYMVLKEFISSKEIR